MKHLDAKASKIMDAITRDLLPLSADGAVARRIGEKGGAIMQVVIERIEEHAYSVAHYFEQNGDLMRDPEMIFVKAQDGQWYPTYYRQDALGVEQTSANFDGQDPKNCRFDMQRQHASFANTWMRNIAEQHPDYFDGKEDGSS